MGRCHDVSRAISRIAIVQQEPMEISRPSVFMRVWKSSLALIEKQERLLRIRYLVMWQDLMAKRVFGESWLQKMGSSLFAALWEGCLQALVMWRTLKIEERR